MRNRPMVAALFLAGTGLVAGGRAAAAPAGDPPICTDRPAKASAACTVPAGRLQLETDLLSWTRDTDAAVRTDTFLYTNPTLKYGLGSRIDIELNLAPLVGVRTRSGAETSRQTGVGDLYLRLKQRLTANEAPLQVALIPWLKAPVARRGIGNHAWEGGVAAAVQLELPADAMLTVGPEADVIADDDGAGRHGQLVGVVNLAVPLSSQLTLGGELWTAQNFDPAGTVRQYSADVAASYRLGAAWQVDFGGNFGLNAATPELQLYAGAAVRF